MKQIALLGNPNTGKTSLFNNLTGSYEYVGNWSGVTVEKKVGRLKSDQSQIIDLPGVYSLIPQSKDEAVVINYYLQEDCSDILNIVDSSQLERNLLLTIQLLELQKPMIIGLNMLDVAKSRGITFNISKLSEKLGIPVLPVNARTGKGCKELMQSIAKENGKSSFTLDYGVLLEEAISKIISMLPKQEDLHVPVRWLAIQTLDNNKQVVQFISKWISREQIHSIRTELQEKLKQQYGFTMVEQWILQKRKEWIEELLNTCTAIDLSKAKSLTSKIDRIVTHPILGIPIFIVFMYLMFQLTFDWLGTPLSDLLDAFISGPISNLLQMGLDAIHAGPFLNALVFDGIVAGVGGVLVFIPQIFILFLFISFLEDSGYMARVALVMDRALEKVGLNGKAFIPMIIGLGCNVPGVMATRTIEQPKERLITLLITPFMSCSARLPVYALFAAMFFSKHQGIVVFSLYFLGIFIALVIARILSSTILKNESSPFVIELPSYHIPHAQTLLRSTWDKGKGFIKKAGTFIFAGSVLIWFLSYTGPGGFDVAIDDSFLAFIGGIIAPLLIPLGFGTWQAGAALLTGFMAKEVVVSTMNIIYHTSDDSALQSVLMGQFTAVSAYSFMAFILLYVPCLATIATIRHETASKKWTLFSVIYSLVLAYIVSFIIYQIGRLIF